MRGQIRKALSGFYYLASDGMIYQTRGRGNFRKKGQKLYVGDWVEFESENEKEGIILKVEPRENELIRPPVANVTLAVVVMSAVEPGFSPNLLDRYLVSLENLHIRPVLFITKMDRIQTRTEMVKWKEIYEAVGYPTFFSDEVGILEKLTSEFNGELAVFMGQSGAGKSTLLNRIDDKLGLVTAEISQSLGRGRHTTRHVELHEIGNGLVADTPGFSAIDFNDIDATTLSKLFLEFTKPSESCKFRECSHTHEPICGVKKGVEEGEISESRYANYLQFLLEIEEKRPVYKKQKKGGNK
ncbi:MAG: ribosome small subunit-dependent GTPase A [Streptococcaceae bacterium]|jgi:ribosome biogenesis GTPase|nr:ribosome small subunit-dependent GTPase A [Streptococcaceae bacterium]